MDRPPPQDPRKDTGYWKTRVERVLEKVVAVPGGDSTVRRWLTAEQMQRTARLDARDGLLFVRAEWGGELSCEVRVYWEVPGAVMEFELAASRTLLSPGVPARVVAWAGPTPGLCCVELRFSNLGPASEAFVQVDLCAKRWGRNFMPGHFFRDRTGALKVPHVARPYDPDPEGRRRPRRRPKPRRCVRVRAPVVIPTSHAPFTARSARPVASSASAAKDSDTRPPHYEPLREFVCEPAASAVDWRLASELGTWRVTTDDGEVTMVPDPEVFRAWLKWGPEIELMEGLTDPGQPFPFVSALFGPDEVESNTFWYMWLCRTEGFDALWQEVSQGLEQKRMPQRWLVQMMSDSWDSWNYYVLYEDGRAADLDGWLRDPDDSTDQAWNWSEPAPWLSDAQGWGLASLVNLVHGTLDLLPPDIRSSRSVNSTIVLDSARLVTRLTRNGDTNVRLAVVRTKGQELQTALDAMPTFSVADISWSDTDAWDVSVGGVGSDIRGETAGQSRCDPVPSGIALDALLTVPYFDAAAQCYAVARLLTMLAAKYEARLRSTRGAAGSMYDGVVELAKTYYKAHLGGFTFAGKSLVHELFHITVWQGPDQWGQLELDEALADTDHCFSGCGQEKMGVTWLLRLCGEHGAWYRTTKGSHPAKLVPVTDELDDNSDCDIPYLLNGEIAWTARGLGTVGGTVAWTAWRAQTDLVDNVKVRADELVARDEARAQLKADIAKNVAELSRLQALAQSDFGAYLLAGGPVAEAATAAALGAAKAALAVTNAWFNDVLGAWAPHPVREFAQKCWDHTADTPTRCGGSGSCR